MYISINTVILDLILEVILWPINFENSRYKQPPLNKLSVPDGIHGKVAFLE